jgi:prepilin-type N-terminal cleavage/methylation domain-containing protein
LPAYGWYDEYIMHMLTRTKQAGFTIVELLIVIVIIGILAAITVVAYNGIQERAESTKIVSQATAFVKGLKLYEADLGRPTASSCIAPTASITGGVCASSDAWNVNTPYDTAFNQALATYSGVATPQAGKYGSSNPAGHMWYHANYYGDNRGVLYYAVGPTSDCGSTNVLSPTPGYDNMTLAGAKFTQRMSGYTRCIVEVFTF